MKLSQLIDSTRRVRTRQYPINKIGGFNFKYVPSTKQLYIEALARSAGDPSSPIPYKMHMVFNQVSSSDFESDQHPFKFSRDGIHIERYLSFPGVNNDVLVRCQCQDFYFMWQWWDRKNKSLLGPHKNYVRKTDNRPPVNPDQAPGLCKHLLGMTNLLMQEGIIKNNVTAQRYLNRPVRKYE